MNDSLLPPVYSLSTPLHIYQRTRQTKKSPLAPPNQIFNFLSLFPTSNYVFFSPCGPLLCMKLFSLQIKDNIRGFLPLVLHPEIFLPIGTTLQFLIETDLCLPSPSAD